MGEEKRVLEGSFKNLKKLSHNRVRPHHKLDHRIESKGRVARFGEEVARGVQGESKHA